MSKNIFLILACFLLAAIPMSATKRATTKNHTHTTAAHHTAAHHNADGVTADDMTLASVSKTNPFEIVPAAGMELLGDIDDGSADAAMIDDMLNYAHKFLGVRYVRGGRSPKGFDCSGFTSYVFGQFGISLSPSSATQYTQGTKVSRSNVQPGDLLFFTGRAARSGRVGHVAIAIDADPVSGEITFIHAARGGIKVDRLTAPYYASRYLGARRVLGK